MKKIIIAIAIFAFIGCEKENDSPSGSSTQTENVEQYIGRWQFNSGGCAAQIFRIEKGLSANDLVFDGINGTVVNKVLVVQNPFKKWSITFSSADYALADYNNGACIGTMRKL